MWASVLLVGCDLQPGSLCSILLVGGSGSGGSLVVGAAFGVAYMMLVLIVVLFKDTEERLGCFLL